MKFLEDPVSKYLVLTLFTGLMVSFQNCAQSKLSQAPQESASDDATQKTSSLDLSTVRKIGIPNEIRKTQIRDASEFEVDLTNGEIHLLKPDGSEVAGQKFCLSSQDLSELKTIMDSGRVCEPENTVLPDQVCTMIYSEPYVRLSTDSTDVTLGERRNGCEKPVDLCGDSATLLRGYVAALVSNIHSKVCN